MGERFAGPIFGHMPEVLAERTESPVLQQTAEPRRDKFLFASLEIEPEGPVRQAANLVEFVSRQGPDVVTVPLNGWIHSSDP
jgi:hypothetical protein